MLWRAILVRLGQGIVTLWVVSILIFVGTQLLPGDIAQIMLGQTATPENTEALRAKLGLDKPAHMQYLVWLGNVAVGDLGISKAGLGAGLGTPIVEMLGPRVINTLRLTTVVSVIAIPISLRASLIAFAAISPYSCELLPELPKSSKKNFFIISKTRRSIGVVA